MLRNSTEIGKNKQCLVSTQVILIKMLLVRHLNGDCLLLSFSTNNKNYISTLYKICMYVCSKTINVFQMVFVENVLEITELFRCIHT